MPPPGLGSMAAAHFGSASWPTGGPAGVGGGGGAGADKREAEAEMTAGAKVVIDKSVGQVMEMATEEEMNTVAGWEAAELVPQLDAPALLPPVVLVCEDHPLNLLLVQARNSWRKRRLEYTQIR